MRSSIVLAFSVATLASAQSNFTIDPNSVPATTRSNWCNGQSDSCVELCVSPSNNTCFPDDLSFNCTCQNGSAPGLQYYIQTMPTFICTQAYTDCINAHPNDKDGQSKCVTDIKDHCGTLDPAKYSPPSSSSSAAPSSTKSTKSPGSPTAVATSTSTAGAVPTAIAHIGSGVAAVAMGVFAYML